MNAARTYEVRTYGCQMNVHDSERLSGLLEDAGYVAAGRRATRPTSSCSTPARCGRTPTTSSTATCRTWRRSRRPTPSMQIAVGGCLAQKDRSTITAKAPYVDVVFGTHNIGSLPVLLERARVQEEAQVEILESLEVFPSTLPTKRESAYAAWVSVSVGCNNTCTFCIVPSLRGKEKDRRPGEILAEIEALVAEGVSEVTLLGQNVNSYGVEFGDRQAFSKLLRACGADRRAGAGPVHEPAPGGVHRRRHRGDGRDAQRDAAAAHAAAVGVRPDPQGDAPVLPAVQVPRHHRPGPRRDARGRDHHRHHHRLPGRDRGRLPGDARRGPAGALRRVPSRSSTPSGPAPPPQCSTSRSRPRSSRTATTGSSSWSTTSPGRRTSGSSAARSS